MIFNNELIRPCLALCDNILSDISLGLLNEMPKKNVFEGFLLEDAVYNLNFDVAGLDKNCFDVEIEREKSVSVKYNKDGIFFSFTSTLPDDCDPETLKAFFTNDKLIISVKQFKNNE